MFARNIKKNSGRIEYFKSTAPYAGFLHFKNLNDECIKYWVFDKLKMDIERALKSGKYNEDTILDISHIETNSKEKNRKFNKIVNINESIPVTTILTGVLSNLDNRRAKRNGTDNVYFCLKWPGEKVLYLYMHKELAKSSWFKKGAKVSVEAYIKPKQDGHRVYEVRSIFRSEE